MSNPEEREHVCNDDCSASCEECLKHLCTEFDTVTALEDHGHYLCDSEKCAKLSEERAKRNELRMGF